MVGRTMEGTLAPATIKTLEELAITATGEIAISSCKFIEIKFPCALGLSFDVDGCKTAVENLQETLRGFITPFLWQAFVDAVLKLQEDASEDSKIADLRILYHFLIRKDVLLKKITINELKNIVEESEDPASIKNRKYVEFWREKIPLLKNLVELDMIKVSCDEIVLSLARTCPDLKVARLYEELSSETLEAVFRSCPKLISIWSGYTRRSDQGVLMRMALELLSNVERFTYRSSGYVFELLQRDNPLKLKALQLKETNPRFVNEICKRCPDLKELDLTYRIDTNESINSALATLTASSLKLSKLLVRLMLLPMDSFLLFLHEKGMYLTDLWLLFCNIDQLISVLHFVGQRCPNLERLTIDVASGEELLALQQLPHKISFPKLQHLSLRMNECQAMMVINYCVLDPDNFTSFQLFLYGDPIIDFPFEITPWSGDVPDIENSLISLFANNPALKKVQELNVYGCRTKLYSANLVQRMYELCPRLTNLKMSLSDEAKLYVKKIHKEAKQRNLVIGDL